MAIEDEAGQIAEEATQRAAEVMQVKAAEHADRVALMLGRFAVDLAVFNETALPPEVRRELILQAGEMAWHSELCHGMLCAGTSDD